MLTIAYCGVSTEDQVEEGYSIEGQGDKLRAYAELRNFGAVTLITDPGLSGKNLQRPGLQQVLAAVEAGHVSHVLVWRLDRLSRNLGDLITLADTFAAHHVALHSVSDKLDLSSASGRMFYNILGTFAQYFREQLSENVRLGNERAIKEGRWVNRPKTGYDLIDGELVPNPDAARVREVFRLRGRGASYRTIEDETGVLYSTVKSILDSRVYLGEVLLNGQFFPGRHPAIVTPEEFRDAHRGFPKGVRRSRDVLSGHVRCGLCHKRMAVNQNGKGSLFYKCVHQGVGCDQPARCTRGLSRAAVLGLALVARDTHLREAIRRELAAGDRTGPARTRRRRRADPALHLARLCEQRRKLLDLYYGDKISADGFHEAESRLAEAIEAARSETTEHQLEESNTNDLGTRFEEVATILEGLDVTATWDTAEPHERRALVEELIEWVTVFPDHLEVKIAGTPRLNVLLGEVGLKESEIVRVGEPMLTIRLAHHQMGVPS